MLLNEINSLVKNSINDFNKKVAEKYNIEISELENIWEKSTNVPKIEVVKGINTTSVTKIEVMTTLPNWYKIPEIPIVRFSHLLKPLYDIIECKKVSKSALDPFSQQANMSFHNISREEWVQNQKKIQNEHSWTMGFGYFHQNLMGSFPGWKIYKTGCDIGKEDDTCVVEVKNNTNTMNSSSRESVLKKLMKQLELGKRSLLVIVNGDIKESRKDGIEIISGRQFYAELSGRPNFIDDLLTTVNESFSRYKSFKCLELAVGGMHTHQVC